MKTKILFLVMCLFAVIETYAQPQNMQKMGGGNMPTGTIKGSVMDSGTKKPVEYANVVVYRLKDSTMVTGVVTDMNGIFKIDNVPFGRYYISANFIGYEKTIVKDVKINPENVEVALGVINLNQATNQLNEVEVTEQRNYVEYKIDKKVVNVNQSLSAKGGTAVDVLENVPSITVDGEGNVQLRGNSNFKVLLDGKPSALSSNDILKQLPASSIENIEIITNPSAKYDPDGTAGIINVILKKEKRDGVNGVINAMVGSGNKYSTDFILNIRRNKVNFFIGGDYARRGFSPHADMLRQTTLRDTVFVLTTDADREMSHGGYTFKTGLDYSFNDKKSLSFSLDLGSMNFERNFYTKYHSYSNPFNLESFKKNDSESKNKNLYFSANSTYMQKFAQKGHEFKATAVVTMADGEMDEFLNDYKTDLNYTPIDNLPVMRRTSDNSNRSSYRFNADYTKPFSEKAKLELGYQGELNQRSYNYLYEDYKNNIWENNTNYSNKMDYMQNTQALYSTFSSELLSIQYQIGLRGEYYGRKLDQITKSTSFELEKFDLFPSIFLTKQLPADQQLQLSYTRRTNRPQDRSLNPYPDYSDENTVVAGNPYLKPEYINSYEFNYSKRIKNSSISLETYYRQTKDMMTRQTQITNEGKLLMTTVNLYENSSLGIEASANLNLAKFWRLNLSSTFSRYTEEGEVDNKVVTQSSNIFTGNVNSTFILSPVTFVQLTGMYMGGKKNVDGESKPFFGTNISIRQELFKRKLSVSFVVRDVLKTQKFQTITNRENLFIDMTMRPEAPVFILNLSYKINNYKQTQRNRPENMDQMDGGF